MFSPRPTARGQQGFTLIEVMVACAILLIGMAATLTLVDKANSTTSRTRAREQATSLQRELVEASRSVAYDQLSMNGVGPAVRGRPALGDSALGSAGWSVRRRNTTYTVSMGVCTVDDPRDGTGAHEAGVFCANTVTPTTVADANLDGTIDGLVAAGTTTCPGAGCSTPADTNPADYKRIVSLVRWPAGSNLQTSQVNNPGLAAAPAITGLTAATNTITDTRASLALTATATGAPEAVGLYLDGTAIGPPFAFGGSTWTDAWNLGTVTGAGAQPAATEIVDGSYQLSAKAFDGYGQYGATRSQTIVVNRRVAFAPAHVEGGRNNGAVELEWSPAKERDSEGFRVDRRLRVNGVAGAWGEVCDRQVRTACRDTSAPTLTPGQSLEYSVEGFDASPPPVVIREGDRSEVVSITDPAPAVPASPGSLQATLLNANVTLTWTQPATGAPDHYNLYRDEPGGSAGYAKRLDSVYITSGQPLTYTDTRTTGGAHDYWITAVNGQLGESVLLGPVRR